MSETPFQLSEPGSSLAQDPAMGEYLRCYEFPLPPLARHGFLRMESPQERARVNLFGQAWVPPHATGTVVLLHGYSEHAGNYAKLVRNFVEARLAVTILDLRGHGLSEGPRGHLEDPNYYAEDTEAFLNKLLPQLLPNRPIYLWGHSLGALVGLQLLHRNNLPNKISAAVFSSAFLGFPELTGSKKTLACLAPLLAAVLPTLPVPHGVEPNILSHDEEYLARRFEDPLISRVATPRWLLSVRAAIQEIQNNAAKFQTICPTLFLLSGDEKVTNLNEARKFAFQAYGGLKHKVIEFPGYYHELEKEPGIRERVVSESLAWITSHR